MSFPTALSLAEWSPRGITIGCALVASLWLGYSGWQFWQSCQAIQRQHAMPLPSVAEAPPPVRHIGTDGIASLFGMAPVAAPVVASAIPLTLKGSFGGAGGALSAALIASPAGEALYRVGDALPGGARLADIRPRQVTLLRNGREEILPLPQEARALLLPVPPAAAARAAAK